MVSIAHGNILETWGEKIIERCFEIKCFKNDPLPFFEGGGGGIYCSMMVLLLGFFPSPARKFCICL